MTSGRRSFKNSKNAGIGAKASGQGKPVLMAISTAAGQAVLFFSLPVVLQTYGPKAFGEFTLIVSIIMTLVVVSTLRLEVVIPTMKYVSLAGRMPSALLALSLLVSIAVIPLGWGIYGLTGWKPGYVIPAAMVFAIMAAGLFVNSVLLILRSWLVRLKRFGGVALMALLRPVCFVSFAISAGYFFPETASESGVVLLFVMLGAVSTTSLAAFAFMAAKFRRLLHIFRFKRMAHDVVSNRKFLSSTSVAQVLNQVALQMPLWGVAAFYGPVESGWVALASRVIVFPAIIVAGSIGTINNRSFSEKYHNGEDITARTRSTLLRLIVAGTIIYGLLWLAAPWITSLVGPKWQGVTSTLQLFCLFYYGVFINSATMFIPVLKRRTRFFMFWSVGRVATFLAVFAANAFWGQNYADFILIVSLINLIFSLVFAGHCAFANNHLQKSNQ